MDNGTSSYRRFRDNGDDSGLDEIIMDYSDGLMLYLTSIVGNILTAEVSMWEPGHACGRRMCLPSGAFHKLQDAFAEQNIVS